MSNSPERHPIQELPAIILPKSKEWLRLFGEKVRQYKDIIGFSPNVTPQISEIGNEQRHYALFIAGELLDQETVNFSTLMAALQKEQAESFDIAAFTLAYQVILDYTRNINFLKSRLFGGRKSRQFSRSRTQSN